MSQPSVAIWAPFTGAHIGSRTKIAHFTEWCSGKKPAFNIFYKSANGKLKGQVTASGDTCFSNRFFSFVVKITFLGLYLYNPKIENSIV